MVMMSEWVDECASGVYGLHECLRAAAYCITYWQMGNLAG
jgi:hypothetical protein